MADRLEDRRVSFVRAAAKEGRALDGRELELMFGPLWVELFGRLVPEGPNGEKQLRRRLQRKRLLVEATLDILNAMLVVEPDEPAPLVNRGMLLRAHGALSEAEFVSIVGALRLKEARRLNSTEEVEEDEMWHWAGKAAAHQGRILTLYAVSRMAPSEETRRELDGLLRQALLG